MDLRFKDMTPTVGMDFDLAKAQCVPLLFQRLSETKELQAEITVVF